jgi:phospholipid N-methyltransferase
VEPASAAGLAGLQHQLQHNQINVKGKRVVAICTGHGLKDPDIIAKSQPQKARRIMKAYAFPSPDCIVSGLPWALFDTQTQRDILAEAKAALKPGGIFTTFAYIHALSFPEAKAFRSLLENNFHSVEMSRIIWNNLPPAIVYRCKKESR